MKILYNEGRLLISGTRHYETSEVWCQKFNDVLLCFCYFRRKVSLWDGCRL